MTLSLKSISLLLLTLVGINSLSAMDHKIEISCPATNNPSKNNPIYYPRYLGAKALRETWEKKYTPEHLKKENKEAIQQDPEFYLEDHKIDKETLEKKQKNIDTISFKKSKYGAAKLLSGASFLGVAALCGYTLYNTFPILLSSLRDPGAFSSLYGNDLELSKFFNLALVGMGLTSTAFGIDLATAGIKKMWHNRFKSLKNRLGQKLKLNEKVGDFYVNTIGQTHNSKN